MDLPVKTIPGGYGVPFFGAVGDRIDFFYKQGTDLFFKTRMEKYGSTVFRSNIAPGPFISKDSRVVVLLDAVSFPILFDTAKVEKRDVFIGTYMPSVSYTGGYRMLAYLDPSEPRHELFKRYFLSLLASKHGKFIPLFRSSLSRLFVELEDGLSDNNNGKHKGGVYFNDLNEKMSLNFLYNLFFDGIGPSDSILGTDKAPKFFDSWLFFQLSPLMTLGLPKFLDPLEDLFLHTFPLPPFLLRSDYKKFYKAVNEAAGPVLDEMEKLGISRDEACHNLIFLVIFNAYGGMKNAFPVLLKWVGTAGKDLHHRLADEIRGIVEAEGGLTLASLEKMRLTKSAVYEALRMEPPVPFQYGHAKEDMVIRSHDAAYEIKKGEMIFGYQPFATRDPKVFEKAEEFVGDRFVGEEGEKLLNYVYWSNGREVDNPTPGNKQCLGKNLVVTMCRVMLAEFFLRYDTFEVNVGTVPLGSSVTFKSLTKAARI
ncbi:hypothetical protein MLD38_032315 [Melastoma candidum]|uniref:Uncharacterized protein n=1 Tax=Melastoma candidum TaxID=119954 RepID=A0ACB9M5P6_9MYRT|nr:hypothetical protein MLD38_032315 [Melastoma candidum]